MEAGGGHRFVLAIGGSFNPPHKSHVAALERAREVLEAVYPGSVVAGYLAVAHGSHVRSKCGGAGAIKAGHRINMCNAGAAGADWIRPVNACYGSAMGCLETLYRGGEAAGLIFVEVVGGDRAKPGKHSIGKRACVMIERSGSEEKRALFEARLKWNKAGLFCDKTLPPGVHASGNDLYVFDKPDKVSSTRIRQLMKELNGEARKRHHLQPLVEEGLLHEAVADYIAEHWDDLFECDG
jgi:nicotinic acid mononucleotide adenylyltransferase